MESVVKMTKLPPPMANQSRFLAATLGFSLLLGPGCIPPGAAEPLSTAPLDRAEPDAFAPDGAATEPSAILSRGALWVPLGEPDVGGTGSTARADAGGTVTEDGWAEAYGDGSRVSYATITAPAYPVTLNPQVQFHLDRFTGAYREAVTRWVHRSSRYLTMIREVLRARGLPEDLAFTAMIESGFKPDAVSRVGATLTVPPSTDLRRLATSAGRAPREIRALNPTLVRGVTPPGRPWTLRLPEGEHERVAAALAPHRTPVVAGSKHIEVSYAASTGDVHVVRPRDTVSTIAKRYGVSVGDVMRWNRPDSTGRIRPGARPRGGASGGRASPRGA